MVSARTSVVAERTNDIILFEYAAYDVELVHTRHRCHQIGPNGMGCLLWSGFAGCDPMRDLRWISSFSTGQLGDFE